MSKPARGTKRVCANCNARFYDLGRSPITCPVCQTVYQANPPSRRSAAAPKPEVEEEDDSPVMGGPEVISLDEAEEAEEAGVEDEEIVDIGDDGDEIPDDDDEDVFLEDDEEEDADVTGIVKGDREEEA